MRTSAMTTRARSQGMGRALWAILATVALVMGLSGSSGAAGRVAPAAPDAAQAASIKLFPAVGPPPPRRR